MNLFIIQNLVVKILVFYQMRSVGGGGKLIISVPTICFTLITRVSSFFATFSKTFLTNFNSRNPEEQFSINLVIRLP